MTGRCDFCMTADPPYVYESVETTATVPNDVAAVMHINEYQDKHNAARVVRVISEGNTVHGYDNLWAACPACADLIDARDMMGLVRRVTNFLDRKLTTAKKLPATRANLIAMYEQLWPHLGPRQIIER